MKTILTIIGAIGAFFAFFLLGASRQKGKDEKTMKEYKAETEAAIRSVNQEAAKAEADKAKADVERYIMKKTVQIVTDPIVENHNEELEKQAEKVTTDEEALDVLKAMQADSQRRAEELSKRYETESDN